MAKHLIMSGNSLELQIPLTIGKPFVIPRLIASGMVIILKIGQSAGNKPKAAKQGYGSPSTTARMLVNYEGLANLSWLKIQSTLWRKSRDHRTRSQFCKSSYSKSFLSMFNYFISQWI